MDTDRVRDKDRDAAVAVVEAACAAGRIVPADRDRRVQELRRAQTQTEIYLLTQDLQGYGVPVAAPMALPRPTSPVPGQPSPVPGQPSPTSTRRSVVPLVVAVAVVLVLGLVGLFASLFLTAGTVHEQRAGVVSVGASPEDDVLTAAGFDDLTKALKAETGSTMVVDALIDPASAFVETRDQAGRATAWTWDGTTLTPGSGAHVPDRPLVDLTTVSGAALVDVVEHAKSLVEDPTTWTAFVEAPDANGVVIVASAGASDHKGVYVSARADGTIVRTSPGQ